VLPVPKRGTAVSGHGFTSAFGERLEDYVEFKHTMGFRGASRIWYLRKFDVYCAEHNLGVFDRETVEGWVTTQLATSGRYRSWMSYIRDFGRWLRVRGHTDAYVLSSRWKAPFVPARPYLLTNREIEAFFAAAARLDTTSPWRWQAVAFFMLMHSCGIRTCEARGLLTGHVDLRRHFVEVLWSKGNRSRRLPITSDVSDILATCDAASKARFGPSRKTFFISSTGNPVTAATVGVIFNRIWDQAGLPRQVGGQRPRPYDFRHHFAYANIERWMTQRIDVAAMLPYLSTYMGHATVESTYYYIHTSPDFMQAYTQITAEGGSPLPEVGFE
jgi:integrase